MRHFLTVLLLAMLPAHAAWAQAANPKPATASASKNSLRSFADKGMPDLFVWTDTCNVYVLRDGDAALLIDLGDGSVLDHLAEIGVKRVEWVLFTHHHREQCQGYPRLKKWNAKIGAPEAERALFERPADFRKMKVRLNDAFTIYGSSYVRPPIQPIPVDRAFQRMDTFEWRGHSFWCLDTRGLIVDGMGETKALDDALKGMEQHLGLTRIDAVIPTHMHGDHLIGAPHLREKWGAQIWTIDRMAGVCEHPERFDYAAPSQAYGTGVDSLRFDRSATGAITTRSSGGLTIASMNATQFSSATLCSTASRPISARLIKAGNQPTCGRTTSRSATCTPSARARSMNCGSATTGQPI